LEPEVVKSRSAKQRVLRDVSIDPRAASAITLVVIAGASPNVIAVDLPSATLILTVQTIARRMRDNVIPHIEVRSANFQHGASTAIARDSIVPNNSTRCCVNTNHSRREVVVYDGISFNEDTPLNVHREQLAEVPIVPNSIAPDDATHPKSAVCLSR
jgi:hypothetical protein